MVMIEVHSIVHRSAVAQLVTEYLEQSSTLGTLQPSPFTVDQKYVGVAPAYCMIVVVHHLRSTESNTLHCWTLN